MMIVIAIVFEMTRSRGHGFHDCHGHHGRCRDYRHCDYHHVGSGSGSDADGGTHQWPLQTNPMPSGCHCCHQFCFVAATATA